MPELKTQIENIDTYDTIFIGFPTWGMKLPPPMKTFLTRYNLKNKTIIPFNTNAGFGVGSGFKTVEELCKDSSVLEGLSVEGGYEKKGIFLAIKDERAIAVSVLVATWLQRVGILK